MKDKKEYAEVYYVRDKYFHINSSRQYEYGGPILISEPFFKHQLVDSILFNFIEIALEQNTIIAAEWNDEKPDTKAFLNSIGFRSFKDLYRDVIVVSIERHKGILKFVPTTNLGPKEGISEQLEKAILVDEVLGVDDKIDAFKKALSQSINFEK